MREVTRDLEHTNYETMNKVDQSVIILIMA